MSIREVHDNLNQIFVLASEVADYLEKSKVENQLQFIAGNYIKIEESFELQAYPIPVLLIKGKGEIGFNLDGIFFEFVMKKDTALRLDVEGLSKDYNFEVYGVDNPEISFYDRGMTNQSYVDGIGKSKENGIGIAFYFEKPFDASNSIYETFTKCFKRIIA